LFVAEEEVLVEESRMGDDGLSFVSGEGSLYSLMGV
jgi:hypothetical protein